MPHLPHGAISHSGGVGGPSAAGGDPATPPPTAEPVSWRFISLYAAAYMSSCLMLIAPLLVTLALKVNALVGRQQAPRSLALVAGTGAMLALFANPIFGKLSDRTTSAHGMRRPWMVCGLAGGCLGILVVAVAPNVPVVLAGWCAAQISFNALLAMQVAVLPDQVPASQRGLVSGVLGICVPVAAVSGTFLVKLFSGNQLAMFLAPCAVGAVFILWFAVVLPDRRLDVADRARWSLHELVATFYVDPRRNRDYTWAFASRFLFVMAYAFLTAYQTYYLLDHLGTAESDVPQQLFLATLAQSAVVVVASLVGGSLSDRIGRRKMFVAGAAVIYGVAMFDIALANDFTGFLLGSALSGLGFGLYLAVDLALVTQVLPDPTTTAKDLGVFNVANALPYSIAPFIAPAILLVGGGSYSVLYAVAGTCAVAAAVAIVPVRAVS
jgi:MFS family permease